MSKTGKLIGILRKGKYWIVGGIALVIVGFADSNSIWRHTVNQYRIKQMQEDIATYNEISSNANKTLLKLKNDPEEVRRVARERYFMKEDDEDIFVLTSDMEKEKEKQKKLDK